MYAHVTTYRLGTEEETRPELDRSLETGEPISDQSARTVASWWHSPGKGSRNITALSHGLPFDTDECRGEIGREITDPTDSAALLTYLDHLEALLTD